MSDVRLEGVSKVFKETVAVDDLSLHIEENEFFSLLGPSGCGKTTTLRIIGGFEEPTAGVVYLGGDDVTNLAPYRRNVNTVFQSYALFPHLDVFENIAFGLRRKKVPKDEAKRRASAALELVDLPQLGNRKPGQLSGGQQQRVALARALVNEPSVLLLDEPLGALDLKLRKQMQFELKRIQNEVGITFIYVTHDQEEAMTMSNRLAVMRAGKVEQIGSPEVVYENPATEFVAGFLGASNLIPGEVGDQSGRFTTVALVEGGIVRLPSERLNGSRGRVKIGVRPEKIRLQGANAATPEGWNTVAGRLGLSTFTGVSHQFTVQGPTGKTLMVYAQNLGGETIPSPGDMVKLMWRPEHTFAVNAQTRTSSTEEES
jgi:spermidine/putrescine transport system ATP-binding protein